MKNIFVVGAAIAAILVSGCRVRDVRTATFCIPEICSEAAVSVASKALGKLPDTSLSNDSTNQEKCMKILKWDAEGNLEIRYDSMKVGTKNIEWELAQIGFNTPTYKANSAARAKIAEKCNLK